MKKIILFTFFSCLVLEGISQKIIYDPNAEVRQVSGFHAIEVSGGIDLYLSNGEEAIAVSAKNAILRGRITTEVRNGVLIIKFESKSGLQVNFGEKTMKAYVSYKTLDAISASGGSDVETDGTIRTDNLVIRLSGGSDLKAKVEVASLLDMEQSGGSDADLSGSAKQIKISLNGGSDFNGYDLVTEVGDVKAGGGSDINITVNKELTADTSGGSNLSWKGTAQLKKVKAGGSGSISHRS